LYTYIKFLEVDVYGLHIVDWISNVGWGDFAIPIKEMIDEITCGYSQVACVFIASHRYILLIVSMIWALRASSMF
jgi:hypothetical protein